MFKVLLAFLILGSIPGQAATLMKRIPVEIIDAAYVDLSSTKTVEIIAKYKGGCGVETPKLNVVSCAYTGSRTYTCVSNLEILSQVNQSCIDKNVQNVFVIHREQIKVKNESMMSEKFEGSTMVIRGNNNSEVKVQLRRI